MIKVVDSIMGSEKTSYIINLLNSNAWQGNQNKYLVATPYLDQVDVILSKVIRAKEPARSGLATVSRRIKMDRMRPSCSGSFYLGILSKSHEDSTFDLLPRQ